MVDLKCRQWRMPKMRKKGVAMYMSLWEVRWCRTAASVLPGTPLQSEFGESVIWNLPARCVEDGTPTCAHTDKYRRSCHKTNTLTCCLLVFELPFVNVAGYMGVRGSLKAYYVLYIYTSFPFGVA